MNIFFNERDSSDSSENKENRCPNKPKSRLPSKTRSRDAPEERSRESFAAEKKVCCDAETQTNSVFTTTVFLEQDGCCLDIFRRPFHRVGQVFYFFT